MEHVIQPPCPSDPCPAGQTHLPSALKINGAWHVQVVLVAVTVLMKFSAQTSHLSKIELEHDAQFLGLQAEQPKPLAGPCP